MDDIVLSIDQKERKMQREEDLDFKFDWWLDKNKVPLV